MQCGPIAFELRGFPFDSRVATFQLGPFLVTAG
jgi:hypothetical protein